MKIILISTHSCKSMNKIWMVNYAHACPRKALAIDQLEKGKAYVLSSIDEPLIKTRYNIMAVTYTRTQSLNGSTLNNKYMDSIRPVTRQKDESQISSKPFHVNVDTRIKYDNSESTDPHRYRKLTSKRNSILLEKRDALASKKLSYRS